MVRLNPNDNTFKELAQSPPAWWNVLHADKDFYAEIRKDNTIDIYYNGGAIITGLKYNKKGFKGKIHYKYLLPENGKYIDFDFDNKNGIRLYKDVIGLLKLKNFDGNTLKRIKANISIYYSAKSEKGIQARFIRKTGGFIDSEFAYKFDSNTRIDLVWVDPNSQKIIFVELKTMGDSRLYNGGIFNQLKTYCAFISRFKNEIKDYYDRLFDIKKQLDLLPSNLLNLDSLTGFEVETKPLLLMGDCEQKWIDLNAVNINKAISDVAIGAYYFGKPEYNCDLIKKKSRNRYVF